MTEKEDTLSPDQIEFTNAFNKHRAVLAGFAKCANREELSVVRDGFYLGLARDLCPGEYLPVQGDVIANLRVADKAASTDGFTNTVAAARASSGWNTLVDAIQHKAATVESDLDGIWKTLERGRLEWLQAASGAHGIKMLLRNGLRKDDALSSAGDVSDAKMIWIYSLCCNIPALKHDAATWSNIVKMKDPEKPLVGYKPELWDPRRDEWRPLDLGAQALAERGGSSLEEAWDAE